MLDSLGSSAAFDGELSTTEAEAGTSMMVTGRLYEVDLNRLVSDRFPRHWMTGSADIRFEPLQLHGGKVVEMTGTLQSRTSGRVSPSLVDAVRSCLEPGSSRPALVRGADITYSHLAFGFQLDEEGLSLRGDADPAQDGVIMASATSGALLVDSNSSVIQLANFIRAISPESDLQVPATREARALFDLLPLPVLRPVDDDRPRASLRLRKGE
jgi:hypothetical protein